MQCVQLVCAAILMDKKFDCHTKTIILYMNLPQECGTGLWIPLVKTSLGSVSLRSTGIQAFHLPASVPVTAKEVLLFVDVQIGNSSPDISSHVKIYTRYNGAHFAKYISVHSFPQGAWSTNSDNIWLPLSYSRTIYVKRPNSHYGSVRCTIDIIGYR